jgi:predicted RecA/RadA family phage recombinase
MATLAANKSRAYDLNPMEYGELPVIASDIIYEGAAVGESVSTGTARPLVAADTFLGFAAENVDNSTGAAAAKNVKLITTGAVWLTVTNGDNINDVGDTVYASDDDTFTLASTGNTAIGKVIRYDATRTNKVLVRFEAAAVRSI